MNRRINNIVSSLNNPIVRSIALSAGTFIALAAADLLADKYPNVVREVRSLLGGSDSESLFSSQNGRDSYQGNSPELA